MLNKKMEKAFNDQLREESFSAYLYLAMSAYFTSLNLNGFAQWMLAQAQEEVFHATKFYNYINQRRNRVRLQALEAPQVEWESPEKAFEDALKHEEHITACINKLVKLAYEHDDFAAKQFLDWFVNEQVEEEASVDEVLQKIKMVKNDPSGVYFLDKELGARTFSAPPAEE